VTREPTASSTGPKNQRKTANAQLAIISTISAATAAAAEAVLALGYPPHHFRFGPITSTPWTSPRKRIRRVGIPWSMLHFGAGVQVLVAYIADALHPGEWIVDFYLEIHRAMRFPWRCHGVLVYWAKRKW